MQSKIKGGAKQNQPNKNKLQARSTQSSRIALQKGIVSQLHKNRSREQHGQLATNFSSHLTLLKEKTESLENFMSKNYASNQSEKNTKLNNEYNYLKNYATTKSVLDLISQEYAQANERLQVKTTRNLYVGGFLQEKHKVAQQLAVQVDLSSENISKPHDKSNIDKTNTTKSCLLEGGGNNSGTQNNSNVSNNSTQQCKIQIQTSGGMQNYPKPSLNLQMKERHNQPAISSKRSSVASKNNNHDAVSQNSAYNQINTLGNCASSVGTAKSHGTLNATTSQGSQKRVYQYCIDTRQIINMIEFAANMMSISQQDIQSKAEKIEQAQIASLTNRDIIQEIYQQRSKSSSDSSFGDKHNENQEKRNKSQKKPSDENSQGQNLVQRRVDIFCAGNKDLLQFVTYFNQHLKDQLSLQSPNKQKNVGKSELFKKATSTKYFDRSKNMDFARVFALDDESQKNLTNLKIKNSGTALMDSIFTQNLMTTPRFTYFVENEKILSRQMFFVELQRENFVSDLKELKTLLQNFIQRKYKNVGVTKIGFSSERELFNILNKMLNNKKGFFNKIIVRKILSQFWMSIKEIFQSIRLRTGIQHVTNIGSFDDFILKNNFYARLEIISRGRYIYEPHIFSSFLSQDEQYIQINNSQNKDTASQSSSKTSNYQNIMYPIHQAVFESKLRDLSKLLKQEVEGVFYCERNQLDPCGNTPLTLAVKLGNLDAVKILSDMYTCPKLRPLDELMNAKEIAIAMKSQPILKNLIGSNQKIKQQFFEQNKAAIFKVLEKMPDFKVDLNLTCDSNWFPVFSSVAPSDTYKIYKCGSNLRLDMTLLGLQKFNLIKGNISVLYKGRGTENEGNLLIIDNKLQTVNNIFNRNKENKINSEIQDILTGKQILKKYQTIQVQHEIENDKQKKINGYESKKFIIKSRYNMVKYQINLAQIEQIKGLQSFDQYIDSQEVDYIQLIQIHLNNQDEKIDSPRNNFFMSKFGAANGAPLTSRPNLGGTARIDNNPGGYSSRERPKFTNFDHINYTQEDQIDRKQKENKFQQNKQITIKKKTQKNVSASLWLTDSYPFDLEGFLPLIHVLSFCSKQIRQFNKFLLKYPLPEKCFPVEARIPLFMSMEAIFSFKNIEMGFNDIRVFDIDKEVQIKQNQNMAIYAKQQISYLNMNSVDTQEDKQAKALKEIYKLCKTDEGDHSNDSHENIYKGMNNQHEEGYDSENSDKIKELFNKMMTNQDEAYDIHIDNQNNNNENSRNQAHGMGISEIRNSLSHSDLIKLRKSGYGNIAMAKTPSKQISINSDITESVEVSERSFNDKLAKLQIHSFQNVKFMSQFKHSNIAQNDQNLHQILVAQFGESAQQMSSFEHFSKISKKKNHLHKNMSSINSSLNHENIYDSKINEERPIVNKSLGKHQINNNLQMWTKAGAKIYKEGQWISKKNQIVAQRPINIANQLQNNQSNATIGTVSGQTVEHPFQPRPVPRVRVNFPGDQQCSSMEGNSHSDISSMMHGQSMSNLSSLNVGGPVSFGHKQVGSGSTVVSGSQGFNAKLGGPNSTNDSSEHRSAGNHGTQNSINSLSSRRLPRKDIKNKPAILDKNKLKHILENLRNDHPQNSNVSQQRPRYLNTIESEGNLPTQFGERKDNRVSLPSKASKGDLSQRSIHSLESLESQGSLEEEKKMNSANSDYNFKVESTNERQNNQNFGYEKGTSSQSQQKATLNIFQKLGNYIQESITDRQHFNEPQPVVSYRSNEDELFNRGHNSGSVVIMKKIQKVVRSPIGAKQGLIAHNFDSNNAPNYQMRVDVNNTEQSENKNMVQPNRFLSDK